MLLVRSISLIFVLSGSIFLIGWGATGWESMGKIMEMTAEKVPVRDYVMASEGVVAILAVIIGVIGFASSRWLGQSLPVGYLRPEAKITRRVRMMFWCSAAISCFLAATINGDRLKLSLWGDEEYTMKRFVIGDYYRDSADKVKLRKVPWQDTIWKYYKPNNHQLNSILARASHEAYYQKTKDVTALHFDEAILRYPAYVAGILAVFAVGWLLAVMGFPHAGIIAMLILAIHPWFTRHGVECRGYAFVLLLFPLAAVFLLKALYRGKWSYWLATAFCQALLFLSFPVAVNLLIPLHLSAIAALACHGKFRGARSVLFRRWLVSSTVAGVLVLLVFAPCILPMQGYLQRDQAIGEITVPWIQDSLSFLASGMPWWSWDASNPFSLGVSDFPAFKKWPMVVFLAFFLLVGIVRLLGTKHQRWWLLALLLPWPLMVGLAMASGKYLYEWYAVITLPGLLALVAIGLDWIPSLAPNLAGRNIGTSVVLGSFAVWFAVVTKEVRSNLREFSVEPLRESVAAMRTVLNPHLPFQQTQEATFGFHMATRGYDPAGYHFKNDDSEKLEQLIAECRRLNRPLSVNFSQWKLAAINYPKIMAIIEREFDPVPSQFSINGAFFGQQGRDTTCTRYVFRLKDSE